MPVGMEERLGQQEGGMYLKRGKRSPVFMGEITTQTVHVK